MERSFDSLNDAVEAANDAADLGSALHAVVGVLRDEFELFSARISALPTRDIARVMASWSIGDTVFTPGTQVSTHFSDDLEALAVQVFSGLPAVVRSDRVDLGLVGHLLRREGVASLVIVPLHENRQVVGIITFGSSSPTAIGPQHVPYFTGLGRGTEEILVPYLREAELAMERDAVS